MDIDSHAAAPELSGANNDAASIKARLFWSILLISAQKYRSKGLESLSGKSRRSILGLTSEEYGQTGVKFTAVTDLYHYLQSVVDPMTSQ